VLIDRGTESGPVALERARIDPSRDRRSSVAGRYGHWVKRFAQPGISNSGVTDIPRKTNYDFERREREKNKAAETAKKAQAKADKRAVESERPDPGDAGDPQVG